MRDLQNSFLELQCPCWYDTHWLLYNSNRQSKAGVQVEIRMPVTNIGPTHAPTRMWLSNVRFFVSK